MRHQSRREQLSYQGVQTAVLPQGFERPELPAILLPSVESILEQLGPLPPYRALAGICEDGMPLLVDLSDPTRAPILIAGDAGSGKTRLLRALVDSTLRLHSPEEVQVVYLSGSLEEMQDLVERAPKHCRGFASTGEPQAARLILELAALAEQRLDGDSSGPAVLLALDDFTPLLTGGFDVQIQLRSLLENGPQAQIWPVATIQAGQALNLHYWIHPFRTRLIGKTAVPGAAQALGIHPGLVLQGQFNAWSSDGWVHFWTPSA